MWQRIVGAIKNPFAQVSRAVALGLAAVALTPEVQVLIASALGSWGVAVAPFLAVVGGIIGAGEKNPE